MTSTETPPSFPTFHVLSRLDLKVAAGGFSKKWKLGEGPRCAPVEIRPFARERLFPRRVLRAPSPRP